MPWIQSKLENCTSTFTYFRDWIIYMRTRPHAHYSWNQKKKKIKLFEWNRFLLVTENKGDVAAVISRQIIHTIDVYYHEVWKWFGHDALNTYINDIQTNISKKKTGRWKWKDSGFLCVQSSNVPKRSDPKYQKLFKNSKNVLNNDSRKNDEIVNCLFPIVQSASENPSELVYFVPISRNLIMKNLQSIQRNV